MRTERLSISLIFTLAMFTAITLFAGVGASAQEKVLHNFNTSNGSAPYAGLVFDSAGNLYGTTGGGGAFGYGTVFELSPNGSGQWTGKTLFTFNKTDGFDPFGLIIDAAGNLYGTTYGGGIFGNGTVFELSPGASGHWTEKVLHSFGNGKDGSIPYGGLVFDAAGNLYGTTYRGGVHTYWGTVFELSPAAGGKWTEKLLHSFLDNGSDGYYPVGNLVFDSVGNLYGATSGGGPNNYGTIFELSPASGPWPETVLFGFDATHGGLPYAGPVFDSHGNLFGTTSTGGECFPQCGGVVYELSPSTGGVWTQSVVHEFVNSTTDGTNPEGTLIVDAAGNLYGATANGGTNNTCTEGCGTVFEMSPSGGGWTETILFNFNGTDGSFPVAGLTVDSAGKFYGTTLLGGTKGQGTVFEFAH